MADDLSTPLHRLADEFTDRMHRADPFTASEFGVTKYDGDLPDVSEAGDQQLRADLLVFQQRAADLPIPADPIDRVLLAVLTNNVHTSLLALDSSAIEHTVTAMPLAGPPVLLSVAARTGIADATAAEAYLARLRNAPAWIEANIDRLRAGAARGRTPVASLAQAAVAWADAIVAEAVPAALLGPQPPDGWDGAPAWRAEVARLGAEAVRPAIARWRDVVRDELLPVARPDDRAGISAIPGGADDYLRAIEIHTTLPLTARELHDTGLATIEILEARALELGRWIGLADLAAIHAAFRASSTGDSASAMEQSRVAIRRAESRVDEVFGPPHAAPCAVEPMPDTVGDSGMPPHYTMPREDGTRPGTYWFNTRRPTIGTGWDLEAVAFHEAVPGHHLQLARAQATTGLPALLTQSLVTVHAEGWGLYAERLSGELGLYGSVEAELGAVFMELHRAGRLVVDTGLHAFGWTRQQAVDFLMAHVPVPEGFVRSEVDRYIAWPGQALAYLTGQREILRLREYARASLGERFDLKGFHGAVLDNGSVPMPALATVVQDWISAQQP